MAIELTAVDVPFRAPGAAQVKADIAAVDAQSTRAAATLAQTAEAVQTAVQALKGLGIEARTVAQGGVQTLVVAERDLANAQSILGRLAPGLVAQTREQAAAFRQTAAAAQEAAAATRDAAAIARGGSLGLAGGIGGGLVPPIIPPGGVGGGGGLGGLGGEARNAAQGMQELREEAQAVNAVASEQSAIVSGLTKQFLELYAALKVVEGIKEFIHTGVEFNATLETARIGIAASTGALGEITDATGRALHGEEAFTAGLQIADEQTRKLIADSLRTTSTFEQLVEQMQAVEGAGLRAGGSLEQIRRIVVGASQAAGALRIPTDQITVTLIQAFEGHARVTNRLAAELGLTTAILKQWQEQGTLVDHLVELFGRFDTIGTHVQGTWTGITARVRDVFQIFSGEATRGALTTIETSLSGIFSQLYDFSTGEFTAGFRGLAAGLRVDLGAIAEVVAEGITAAVHGAERLGAWLTAHKELVAALAQEFVVVVRTVGRLVGDVASVALHIVGAATGAGVFNATLQVAGTLVALLRDGFKLIVGVILEVSAVLSAVVLGPVGALLKGLGAAANLIHDGWGNSLTEAGTSLHTMVGHIADAAHGIFQDFREGKSALAQFTDEWAAAQIKAQHTATLWDQTQQQVGQFLGTVKGKPLIEGNDAEAQAKAIKEEVSQLVDLAKLRAVTADDIREITRIEHVLTAELHSGNVERGRRVEILEQLKKLHDAEKDIFGPAEKAPTVHVAVPKVRVSPEDAKNALDQDFADTLREQTADSIAPSLADGIAQGFERGLEAGSIGKGFAALTNALLSGLGKAMVQFGEKALLASQLMESIKKGLASFLPGGAIAASIAMIALGSALQAAASAAFGHMGEAGAGAALPTSFASSTAPSTSDVQHVSVAPAGPMPTSTLRALPTPVGPNYFFGPNDPTVQRQFMETLRKAERRGFA
jgi:Flp pilus assembly pilin Flp